MRSLLLDTNIWLRMVQPQAPQHTLAVDALATLVAQGDTVYFTAQNVIEFWSVATRPVEANGLGWSVEATKAEVDRVMALFPLLADTPAVFTHWLALVSAHRVTGRRVHDARLVAVMLAHGVHHVLTFNGDDFRAFNEIVVVEPADVVPASGPTPSP
jgi:predicted nucleic acid-binding protein